MAGSKPASVPSIDSRPSLALLYDLAVKRHESLDRKYETLNGRAGAVFGFSSFLLSTAASDIQRLNGRHKTQVVVGIVLMAVYAIMALFCWRAYTVRKIETYPDPVQIYSDYGSSPTDETQAQLLVQLGAAWKTNAAIVESKATLLSVALWCLMAEILVIVVASAIATWSS